MAIVKWEPFFPRFFNRMPALFDEDEWSENEEGLSVYETDDNLVVEAKVPGVNENEIDISVENGVITIKAEHNEEEEKGKRKVVYRRTMAAKYLYTSAIPCPIQADKAAAELKNGILTVILPKAEMAKPKKIAVRTKTK